MPLPTLRTQLLRVNPANGDIFKFTFPCRHLVVGFVLPTLSDDVQKAFIKGNLMPYEAAVNIFLACDYKYNTSMINEPIERTFQGINQLNAIQTVNNAVIPVIIAYLDFTNT